MELEVDHWQSTLVAQARSTGSSEGGELQPALPPNLKKLLQSKHSPHRVAAKLLMIHWPTPMFSFFLRLTIDLRAPEYLLLLKTQFLEWFNLTFEPRVIKPQNGTRHHYSVQCKCLVVDNVQFQDSSWYIRVPPLQEGTSTSSVIILKCQQPRSPDITPHFYCPPHSNHVRMMMIPTSCEGWFCAMICTMLQCHPRPVILSTLENSVFS